MVFKPEVFIKEIKDRHWIWLIIIISIIANIILFLIYSRFQFGIGTVEYWKIANNIASGHGFVFKQGDPEVLWRPPLYIYFLSSFFLIWKDPYLIIVTFQILLHAGIGVLTFILARQCFPLHPYRIIGALSALGLALYPPFAFNAFRIMPESVYTFGLLIIGWLLHKIYQKPRAWLYAVLGVTIGISALNKSSVQFLPIFLILGCFFFPYGEAKLLNRIGHLGLTLVVMILTILPWTIRNILVSNEFIFLDTSGGYTVWIGNRLETHGFDDDPLNPKQREQVSKDIARILGQKYTKDFNPYEEAWGSGEASGKLYAEAINNVLSHPLATIKLGFVKLYRFWFFYTGRNPKIQSIIQYMQGILLIPVSVGMILAFRVYKSKLAFWPLLLYFPLLHMAATAGVRYSMPLMPYAMLFSSFAFVNLAKRIKNYRARVSFKPSRNQE
jgi:4-amino-4-deoxy-L-arabinose transferase-like glycosyltransferase